MVQYREFEGKNVAKAVDIACEELQVSRKELKHDILSYGSTGIFGLAGSKSARIRVEMPDVSVDEALNGPDGGSVAGPGGAAGQGVAHPTQAQEEVVTAADDFEDADASAAKDDTEADDLESDDPAADEDALHAGQGALEIIVAAITEDARVTQNRTGTQVLYRVDGGNAAVLIGKKGQTLEAIKSIVDKIVNKRSGRRFHVQVDIGGYLEKRQDELEKMATNFAEKVRETGKPVSLGQMNARDRRVVHLILKGDADVKTQSLGDGYIRKLMIFPKKRNGSRRR